MRNEQTQANGDGCSNLSMSPWDFAMIFRIKTAGNMLFRRDLITTCRLRFSAAGHSEPEHLKKLWPGWDGGVFAFSPGEKARMRGKQAHHHAAATVLMKPL